MTRLLSVLSSLFVVGLLGTGAAFAQDSIQTAGAPTAMEEQGLAPVSPPTIPPPPSPGYYSPASVERPPADEAGQETGPERKLGIGYKIGNGVGFVGGDIVINPIEHISIDLQANYASVGTNVGTAKGFALAPGLQGHLWAGQRSSPYLGAAFIYLKMGVNGETVSLTGMAFNVGWEWKWQSGLGVILGGGVAHIMNVADTNSVQYNGKTTMFNLEAGVRYMFL